MLYINLHLNFLLLYIVIKNKDTEATLMLSEWISNLSILNFLVKVVYIKTCCFCCSICRVAIHLGILGKLREFSSLRKSQGISGNFDLFFKLRETQGSFDIF